MAYNGYSNYETWAVNLWIDNEEGSQEYWREAAQEAWDGTDEDADDRSHDARQALADRLKDEHEQAMPEVSGVFSDLLTAAMGEVDWYEVADAQLSGLELDGYKDRDAA